MQQHRDTIIAALRQVYDPCCADRGISVVDMGLIDDIHVDGERASVDLVLTSGWCPFVVPLLDQIRECIAAIPSIATTDVNVVWDRPWTSERMSDLARDRLQFLPPPSRRPDTDPMMPIVPSPPANPQMQTGSPEVTP